MVAGSVVGVPGVNVSVLREPGQDEDEDEEEEEGAESEEEWLQLQRLHLGGYHVGLAPDEWVPADAAAAAAAVDSNSTQRPGDIGGLGDLGDLGDLDPHEGGFRVERDGSRREMQQMFCMSLR